MIRNLLMLEQKAYQEAKNMFPVVRDVLRKFDGKRVTNRIKTELDKVAKDLIFSYERKDYSASEITIKHIIRERHVSNPLHHTSYIRIHTVDILTVRWAETKGVVDSEFRLNFAEADKILEDSLSYIESQIAEIDKDLEQRYEIEEDYRKIKRIIEDYNNKYSYRLMDYKGLKISNLYKL